MKLSETTKEGVLRLLNDGYKPVGYASTPGVKVAEKQITNDRYIMYSDRIGRDNVHISKELYLFAKNEASNNHPYINY